jgi:integrase
MDKVKLPHNCALFQEGGFWILRWADDLMGVRNSESALSCTQVRIGPAASPEGLTESDAQRLARRHLLFLLRSSERKKRFEMTISEFVESRFVPHFVSPKTLPARNHYHSILKHVLTPEEVGRIFGAGQLNGKPNLKTYPDWPYLSDMRLRDVGPGHVQRIISAASARGYSTQTIRHIRNVVSAIFSFAKQELVFIGENPVRTVKVPETARKGVPVLTLAQTQQILRVMRYPEKEMTIIALLTDMNLSEVCGLRWKNVNLTGAWLNSDSEAIPPITIAVRKQWYRGELSNVKDTRKRVIRIPEMLLPVLLILSGRNKFAGPDDFVLTSRSGAAINVTNITARRLNVIGGELQMPGLTWQAFRRAHTALEEAFGPQFQYHIATSVIPDEHQSARIPKDREIASGAALFLDAD